MGQRHQVIKGDSRPIFQFRAFFLIAVRDAAFSPKLVSPPISG
jgi:hypothetical protein